MSQCLYCGNNPVSHLPHWLSESSTVIMAPMNGFAFGHMPGKLFFKYVGKLLWPLFLFMEKVKMVTYSSLPSEKTSSRAEVLWEEAQRRGLLMQRMMFMGNENDTYRVFIKGKKIYFNGLPRPPYMPHTAEWWMDDKARVKEVLQAAGIPVAAGGAFTSYGPLLKRFRTLEKPVIIKPRLGSRGRHTTTHIYNETDLKKAFKIAKQLCHWVVMEEHLVGSVYRATMIGGKLCGILRGDPPRVSGDGSSTIRQLIKKKDEARHEKVSPVKINDQVIRFLARTGRTLDSVIPAGEEIDLLEKIGVSYGGHSAEETELLHPKTKVILEKAAAAINDPMIGFDFIMRDISADPDTQKWGIIEANGVPFVNLHHDPVVGYRNVAKEVWDFVEENLNYY